MFTQSIIPVNFEHVFAGWEVLHIPLSHIKECRCLDNVIHQIDIRNKWLLNLASFTLKFGSVLVLTLQNDFLEKVSF